MQATVCQRTHSFKRIDFLSASPLNAWLNMLSGNLLPITSDEFTFPIRWRIYSAFIWLLEIVHTGVLITGCIVVPREKALKNGIIGLVMAIEVFLIVSRIHARRGLMQRFIKKLNNMLSTQDETMKNIVMTTLKPLEAPLKIYSICGSISVFIWCSMAFPLAFQKQMFFYVDYQMPVVYSREPFSNSIFILGSILVTLSSVYIFIKKISVDIYMMHLILLLSAQYQYFAVKLVALFRDKSPQNRHNKSNNNHCDIKTNSSVKKEIGRLCRHHNVIVQTTLILKQLLSLNFSLIYLNNVFRFCSIGIMLFTLQSQNFLEKLSAVTYAGGALMQLYILCFCVQKLLDTSIEITDEAFHEGWYRLETSMKRTFSLIVLANNLECRLSSFVKFNLSLPSFMAILNQSYSIILLLLKTI